MQCRTATSLLVLVPALPLTAYYFYVFCTRALALPGARLENLTPTGSSLVSGTEYFLRIIASLQYPALLPVLLHDNSRARCINAEQESGGEMHLENPLVNFICEVFASCCSL